MYRKGQFVKKDSNKIIYQDEEVTKFLIESPKYGNREVIINTEDWEKVKKCRWHYKYTRKDINFYIETIIYKNNKRKYYYLHRFILNVTNSAIQVDHKNHNTFDNRSSNLRECTPSENAGNAIIPRNNTSGFKGVRLRKGSWHSQIKMNGKLVHLGTFKTSIDAARAYNEAAKKYHKEFAYLNIIPEDV